VNESLRLRASIIHVENEKFILLLRKPEDKGMIDEFCRWEKNINL
jgi:hypothetical protein